MPRFNYRFINEKTGRLNKGSRKAYDEDELRADLKGQGVDPVEIEAEPPEPATDRQLDFLKDLGVTWTGDLTKAEASDLIDNSQNHWAPMQPSLGLLARRYRVETTRFTSKEQLYRSICWTLSNAGRDRGLAEWFTYRVYRTNCDRSKFMIDFPGDPQFASTVDALVADGTALRSLQRAARETGSGFRWFGTFTTPDGYTKTGDSRQTACFKLVHQSLAAANLVPAKVRSDAQVSKAIRENRGHVAKEEAPAPAQRTGCLGSAILLFGCASILGYWLF